MKIKRTNVFNIYTTLISTLGCFIIILSFSVPWAISYIIPLGSSSGSPHILFFNDLIKTSNIFGNPLIIGAIALFILGNLLVQTKSNIKFTYLMSFVIFELIFLILMINYISFGVEYVYPGLNTLDSYTITYRMMGGNINIFGSFYIDLHFP
ncbi:MAG: hypothetical protein ACFFE5_16405 [Candidatus Thorarchaeota archaeon]